MLLRKRSIGTLLFSVVFILIPILFVCGVLGPTPNPINTLTHRFASSRNPQVTVPPTVHIVLFQFKNSASRFQIKDITSRMLALKKSCIHPTTKTPYIKSLTGGKDNSIENLQQKNGISHAFVVEFNSNEDRDYYVNEDPVHQAFKAAAGTYLEKAEVVDFQADVFT